MLDINPDAPKTAATAAVPKWQHYASARPALRMITKEGIRISFTKFSFMTQQQEVIDYLDDEIAAGLNVITKGELLTAEESDPLEALRRKHIAEYKQEQEDAKLAELRGESRDFGSTAGNGAKLKPTSTKDVAV